MGLLSEGSPLDWEETKRLANHVRSHGIIQFVNLYRRLRGRTGDVLKWGDEVEYVLVKLDRQAKKAQVSLRAKEILDVLRKKELQDPNGVASLWRPEYGAYMVEGTPGKPYGGLLAHFNIVEANMRARREEVQKLLEPDEVLLTLTSFPRLGCPDFTAPSYKPTPQKGVTRSLFFPDEAIFPGHPRFATLSQNIRERRGEKVAINIPLFKDSQTPSPYVEDLAKVGDVNGESQRAALPDHIYMDAMGFGMGCCCLQLTFQACNIEEAMTLYDQLAPLCPIMLALTAASPIHRGLLADVDCRWNVISASVDCRTAAERGLEPLKPGERRIYKSRYDSIDSYLSPEGQRYNDIPLVLDEATLKHLLSEGIEESLARHVAHLFIRDPVSLFTEKVEQDDSKDTDHFENLQSTNWQTMRFKPPPPDQPIGWRVEFRPCEVQLTDFENAALVCFVVLLTRVVLSYRLNFLLPISLVDENMQRAQRKDALRTQKFWFRRDILTGRSPPEASSCCCAASCEYSGEEINPKEFIEMSLDEIVNGQEDGFTGLVPLIHSYLSSMDVDADTHCTIQQYLALIQKRASGELKTCARWIRDFVVKHPQYRYGPQLVFTGVVMQGASLAQGGKFFGRANLGKGFKQKVHVLIQQWHVREMGVEAEGLPLNDWSQVQQAHGLVARRAATHFLRQLKQDRQPYPFQFGYELEHLIVHLDFAEKEVKLALNASNLLPALNKGGGSWQPEFAEYMLESMPDQPFKGISDIVSMESTMLVRRKQAEEIMDGNHRLVAFALFPRLGCQNFTTPSTSDEALRNISDQVIYRGSTRYSAYTRGIQTSKGHTPCVMLPVFRDRLTRWPWRDPIAPRWAPSGVLCAEGTAVGASACAVQVTVQAPDFPSARRLYDQLAAMAPIFLALSAASPALRGMLLDSDTRWPLLVSSFDSRPTLSGRPRVSSIGGYLSEGAERFNDLWECAEHEGVEESVRHQMESGGADSLLARHVSTILAQPPLLLHHHYLQCAGSDADRYFHDICLSFCYQTVRLKPPSQSCGWRVEFRPCEAQMSEVENAAFMSMVVLLSRAVLRRPDLNFRVPVSFLDDNMCRATIRDAVLRELFWFPLGPRKNISCDVSHDRDWNLMSVNQIVNGIKGCVCFPGLAGIIKEEIEFWKNELDMATLDLLESYLCLWRRRASGESKTTARWIRDFVRTHPDYRHNSEVTEKILHDLVDVGCWARTIECRGAFLLAA